MKFSMSGQAFTPVPTVFLKEYMCNAPQDYVRVYLYALCLASEGGQTDEAAMEEALHLSAAEIERALLYWAQKGLVRRLDGQGQYEFLPSPQPSALPVAAPVYQHRAYNQKLETLLARQLSPAELNKIHDFTEVFCLPHDVVLLLVEQTVAARGANVSVAYLDKVAQSWAEDGIKTREQAIERTEDYRAANGGARTILRQMGITGKNPDKTQQELYAKWTESWGFTQETIQFAMKGVEFSTGSPFKYLDAILRSLYERGITTAAGISAYTEGYERRRDNIRDMMRALDYNRINIQPSHERFYDEWEAAGYSHETILLACAQSKDNNSRKFESVDALLGQWNDLGLATIEDIQKHIKKQDRMLKRIEQVYGCAGIKKQIAEADRRWYATYRQEHKMNHDVLMYAAEISSLANEPASFLRKVISDWAKNGVTTLKAAMQQNLNRFSGDMKKSSQDFSQHQYTDDELTRRRRAAMKIVENTDG